jgi:predicted MPP superfamily phosphohydrolase
LDSTWGFIFPRITLLCVFLSLLYFSQRFWFVRFWRLSGRAARPRARRVLRVACGLAAVGLALYLLGGATQANLRLWRGSMPGALVGLWLSSALLAWLAVGAVKGVEWIWQRVVARRARSKPVAVAELESPSRRYFFQTASYLAGAVPFVGALYGFAAERLRYEVERVEVPIANLPAALDGLRIAQLSDIHIGSYMPREQVHRAVTMANELQAHLAVITGDFLTGVHDPLEACIAELARLRAPLGAWGCNGNHEIYADAEDAAEQLFQRYGMRLLRQQSAELRWRGQPFNLIGVDYQRQRSPSGKRLEMLQGVERLVRRDVPNILLSHNPNAFPRATEMGIELTLAGHTHGGQVQVEILDRKFSPARFMTPYIAGMYHRPLPADPQPLELSGNASSAEVAKGGLPLVAGRPSPRTAHIYVNRGLGTIGAPVRIGSPPEITLLVLKRA